MTRRPGLGLRARASLAVAALVLAVAALAVVVVKRADTALEDVERARFDVATQQLADAVGYGVLARSEALMAPALDAFARSPDLVDVDVTAASPSTPASPLASRAGNARGRAGGVVDAADVVDVRAPVSTRGTAPGDDGELEAFGVTAGAPRVIGTVHARWSSGAIAAVQRKTRREIGLLAAGLGLFGVLVAAGLMTSVVRRVRKVADAAAQVRAGNRAFTLAVDGADELARLAEDFNAMTRALDDGARALAEREALAAIGRATAVIAHELKNPLGIVLGAAQIVGNAQKPQEARAQAAAIVEEEVRRLARTLEDLLAYARPRPPERKSVDVRAACEQAAARALHAGGPMHGEGHTVAVASKGAGAREGEVRARVDEGHLQQVLLNLVQNAAQAGARAVTLTVTTADARVLVEVTDDGPGVSPAMREQLFLPFATDKQRGSGLGLAASRRLARDNGGELAYVEGSRFVITLEGA